MKKILMYTLLGLFFCCPIVRADTINNVQNVKVKDSYLTSVRVEKNTAQNQEVTVTKSFLVRVYVKGCNCTPKKEQ